MDWMNWSDVDKFAQGMGLSEQKAHELNQDPIIQEKRQEFKEDFEIYQEPLNTILWSQDPNTIGPALLEVPNDVLVAFFGILGPKVIRTKTQISGGSTAKL